MKKGHQEAENIISYFKNLGGKAYIFLKPEEIPVIDNDSDIGILNQITLNFKYVMDLVDKIKLVYKNISLPPIGDVCKATFDRQKALKDSLDKIDILIVIGGKNSSNTKELVNIGKQANKETYHIESVDELKNIKIDKTKIIGITAGASTPGDDIRKVFNYLKNL